MIKNLNRNLPEQGKIKIGGKGEVQKSRAGNEYQLPKKWSHIAVTTLERDESENFIIDEELTKKLGDGTLTPKKIGPCMFIFNEPELNFYTTYAYYLKSKIVCKGNGETACRYLDDGIPKEIECDPKMCEFARDNKCKPNGILSVLFPWSGTIGGCYKFRTTSWNSIISLKTQLEMFWTLTGGRLSGPKFNLCINSKNAMPDGKKQKIYFLTLEFDGNIQNLIDSVPATPAKQLDTTHARRLMLESAGQVDEDLPEFYPEHQIDDTGMVTDNETGEIVDKVDTEEKPAESSPFAEPELPVDRDAEVDKLHLIETTYKPNSKVYSELVADYEEKFGDASAFPACSDIGKAINPEAKAVSDMTMEQITELTDTIIVECVKIRRKLKEEPAKDDNDNLF
jgi:hypothetical protein